MNVIERDEDLHQKAVELVRAAYGAAERMVTVDLVAVNEPRPPQLRYENQDALVREFVARAGAMLDFAGHLGLIEPDEAAQILRTLATDYPALGEWFTSPDDPSILRE